jgi:hypothetical protein
MAVQRDGMDVTFTAGADLSAKQYYFMEQSTTDNQVSTTNAATDRSIGVLQNKPAASGRAALVRVLGHTKIVCGENLASSEGSLIGSNVRGSATALTAGTSTTAYVMGILTVGQASTSIGEMVLMGGPARAA